MDTPDLDFKEAPKDVNVAFDKFTKFYSLAVDAGIEIHALDVKLGFYHLQMNKPLPDDMKHLVIEDRLYMKNGIPTFRRTGHTITSEDVSKALAEE